MIAGIVFFAATGFQQERSIEKGTYLDLKLSCESCETKHEIPEYLSLSLKNTSSKSLKLAKGLIVLEVRSLSGGVVARLPVGEEIITELSGLHVAEELSLKPNQHLNLTIPVKQVLEKSVKLENKTYTINAFLTEEKDPDKLYKADKIRSNYLDLELGKEDEELSYRPLK